MKRTIVSLSVLLALTGFAYGQNDTTKVATPNIKFDKVEYVSKKTAEVKTEYIVVLDGKEYKTNKTSYERYRLIRRMGGVPCVVKITTKSGAERIAVL